MTTCTPEPDEEPQDEVQGIIGAIASALEDDDRPIDPRRIISTVRVDDEGDEATPSA